MGKDESEGSRKINESEIAESDETNFGEFKEISENYNGQEEHADYSEYADSCSDSNDNADVDFWLVNVTYSWLILIILFLTNDILTFLPHLFPLFLPGGWSACQSIIRSPKG